MIIETLLNLLYTVFKVLTLPINIPSMPTEALDMVETVFEWLSTGAGILAVFTPFTYLMVLFGVILAIDAGIAIYHLVMWVIRKIPVLGIS